MVAGLDAFDGVAGGLDHAGGFMTESHRRHRHPALAAHDVQIGPAQPDGGYADLDFGGFRRVERDGFDRQRRANGAE